MRCFFFFLAFLAFLLASENDQNIINRAKSRHVKPSKERLARKALQNDSLRELKAIGELDRHSALKLLKRACNHGAKKVADHLTAFIKPSLEESVEMVSEAVKGGHVEMAKALLNKDLSWNVENTIGLACLSGHPATISLALETYQRTPYRIFELLVETALSTEDSSYYLALENLLVACPGAGSDYNGQSFFFAALKHANYQLADILFRACTVDVTYLEPFIITETLKQAGRYLSTILDAQMKLGHALFMAVKSNHPRSLVELMGWAKENRPGFLDGGFAVKTVRLLGRKLEASAPTSATWMAFFDILLGFKELSLYEKEQIMVESGLAKMANILGLLKAYYALVQMESDDREGGGDFWLPRDLIHRLVSAQLP